MYLDAIEEYDGEIIHCEKKNAYDGLILEIETFV